MHPFKFVFIVFRQVCSRFYEASLYIEALLPLC